MITDKLVANSTIKVLKEREIRNKFTSRVLPIQQKLSFIDVSPRVEIKKKSKLDFSFKIKFVIKNLLSIN